MINGQDKISEFPKHFNRLEEEVKGLNKNAKGIKIAVWITAFSSAVLAIVGVCTLLSSL